MVCHGEMQSRHLYRVPSNDATLKNALAGEASNFLVHDYILGQELKMIVEDLQCIDSPHWLNSETINAYTLLIDAMAQKLGHNVTHFNSFFMENLRTKATLFCNNSNVWPGPVVTNIKCDFAGARRRQKMDEQNPERRQWQNAV